MGMPALIDRTKRLNKLIFDKLKVHNFKGVFFYFLNVLRLSDVTIWTYQHITAFHAEFESGLR